MNGGSIWQLVVVDTKIKDKREKVPLQSAVYAAVREQSFSSKIILSLPGTIMPHSNKEGCSEGKSLLGRENKGAHSSLLVIIFPLIDRDLYNQLTICGDKVIIGKVLEQPFQVVFLEQIFYPNFHRHGNWEYSIANLQLCTLSRA